MLLGKYLKANGISQKKFAGFINVSKVTVSKLVTGKQLPNNETAKKIFIETNGQVTIMDFSCQDHGQIILHKG
jgi:transcriptional regulator with XRE-family HTH domain